VNAVNGGSWIRHGTVYSGCLLYPTSPEELAEALRGAAGRKQTVMLGGAFSKRGMAGPVVPADVSISTSKLDRLLQYEPRDLTVSVEAGMPYRELSRILAENQQMIPLDPPFSERATVGGVLATNSSGPRRRLYGTARDLVIGMKFATLEGKIVQSGGMVVKNVAGLDMGKLMIGSFGTLAALAVVNFKLLPIPSVERTFLLSFQDVPSMMQARNTLLKSALQPAAIDLLNPAAAAPLGTSGFVLAIRAGGNPPSMERYEREVSALGTGVALEGYEAEALWSHIQEFVPRFLEANPEGVVVRISSTLAQVKEVAESTQAPMVVRAGSGVSYVCFENAQAAGGWTAKATVSGWSPVVEFAPEGTKERIELWPRFGDPTARGAEFEMMKKIKLLFDPDRLLNRGRLYNIL
jgi:glycolate oxidase FAD binding subunit